MVPNLVYSILTILFFILQRGTWSDSETERLLRAILKYAKSYIYDKGKYKTNYFLEYSLLQRALGYLYLFTRTILTNVQARDKYSGTVT